MASQKFFQNLKKAYTEKEKERKQIIGFSNIILHDSKRVIFAIHRNDIKTALDSLTAIEKVLKESEKKFSHARLSEEGSYRAGIEEYVEARLLFEIITTGQIKKIPKIKITHDLYLSGLCDVTGELVRRAINMASIEKWEEVKKSKNFINEIIDGLMEFDMTGYLRTKYDQARQNLRKIEQIAYEVKLKCKD